MRRRDFLKGLPAAVLAPVLPAAAATESLWWIVWVTQHDGVTRIVYKGRDRKSATIAYRVAGRLLTGNPHELGMTSALYAG